MGLLRRHLRHAARSSCQVASLRRRRDATLRVLYPMTPRGCPILLQAIVSHSTTVAQDRLARQPQCLSSFRQNMLATYILPSQRRACRIWFRAILFSTETSAPCSMCHQTWVLHENLVSALAAMAAHLVYQASCRTLRKVVLKGLSSHSPQTEIASCHSTKAMTMSTIS